MLAGSTGRQGPTYPPGVELAQVIIGVVAALATLWAVWYARDAARSGKDAVNAARRTVEPADRSVDAAVRSRLADARDRRRRRLERVGGLLEDIFREANGETATGPNRWIGPRNELRHALVGLHDDLPMCVEVVNSSPVQLFGAASRARGEVETALRKVDAEDRANP